MKEAVDCRIADRYLSSSFFWAHREASREVVFFGGRNRQGRITRQSVAHKLTFERPHPRVVVEIVSRSILPPQDAESNRDSSIAGASPIVD